MVPQEQSVPAARSLPCQKAVAMAVPTRSRGKAVCSFLTASPAAFDMSFAEDGFLWRVSTVPRFSEPPIRNQIFDAISVIFLVDFDGLNNVCNLAMQINVLLLLRIHDCYTPTCLFFSYAIQMLSALYDMHVYARIGAVSILNAPKLQANDSHELSCEIGSDTLFSMARRHPSSWALGFHWCYPLH